MLNIIGNPSNLRPPPNFELAVQGITRMTRIMMAIGDASEDPTRSVSLK
jgi:hypothetical protein